MVRNEKSCEKNIELLNEKIFDILKSVNGDAAPIIPHAVHALYLLKKIRLQINSENKLITSADNDTLKNCVKLFFEKKIRWETAKYIFKSEYFSLAKSKLKENRKIAAHLGISLTTVINWNRALKRNNKL